MDSQIISSANMLPDQVPIFPLEGQSVFPGMITQMIVSQPFLIEIIEKAEKNNGFIGLTLIKDITTETPSTPSNLYEIGTIAKIHRKQTLPENGRINVYLIIIDRMRIVEYIRTKHPLVAKIKTIQREKITNKKKSPELVALTRSLIKEMKDIIANNPVFSEDVRLNMVNIDQPGQIADFLTSILNLKRQEQQEILETFDLQDRIIKVLTFLNREKEVLKIQQKIQTQISDTVENHRREHFLREMLKEIKKELGEPIEGKTEEIQNFRNNLSKLPIDDDVRHQIEKDIDKLELLDPHNPEHSVLSGYLEKVIQLPWEDPKPEKIDLETIRKVLDKQHYGLEKVKDRIIEHMAIQQLEKAKAKSIICLVGPPGVGKTSIARSIAEAIHKKLYHFSVGGMRDEAEIKGHRRTYIGAMPGKIIQGLLLVKEKAPVFVIDEIDKLSHGAMGDPSSALLEVLDPVQNTHFRDLYIDIPFDLSKIFFITTANTTQTIPKPLLDRMEVIEISGYIDKEKISIAKQYIIPKTLETHGLHKKHIKFSHTSLKYISEYYAREAGLRIFEQSINKIIRKEATKYVMLRNSTQKSKSVKSYWPLTIEKKHIEEYLGKPPFRESVQGRATIPGTAIGLAWTVTGGTTLIIETQAVKGTKSLKMTGTLGDVMKESVQIAQTLAENFITSAQCEFLNSVDRNFFDTHQIHLHVPEGATPKDGPSAGITIAVALISLAINKKIKSNFAMTGEISLTKQVLPIGGIKEKLIAAQRNKITNIIIPQSNTIDIDEIPTHILKGLIIYPVKTLDDVLSLLFPTVLSASHTIEPYILKNSPHNEEKKKNISQTSKKAARPTH